MTPNTAEELNYCLVGIAEAITDDPANMGKAMTLLLRAFVLADRGAAEGVPQFGVIINNEALTTQRDSLLSFIVNMGTNAEEGVREYLERIPGEPSIETGTTRLMAARLREIGMSCQTVADAYTMARGEDIPLASNGNH